MTLRQRVGRLEDRRAVKAKPKGLHVRCAEGENSENNSETGHRVGNCKPPKEYQWRPGQSGNPSGRPKGSKNRELSEFEREIRRRAKELKRLVIEEQTACIPSHLRGLLRRLM